MPAAKRRGFTLLELIAALSLMGFATMGGILLLDALTDSAARIASESATAARAGNGERLLDRLLLDATSSTDTTKRFRGDEHGVELYSTCETSGGWTEPCRITLGIDQRAESSFVLAQLSTGESYTLRHQFGAAELRYFNSAATSDTVWVKQWTSNIALPAAVALLVGSDTIVYPVSVARE